MISPDADDTALVWRIAPSAKPERLRSALATLGRYRTTEGLYRTWLSPRDRYQCIDPGRDPNPADVAIQMHVLMLLARADPPAARALCSALARVIDQDHVWVYYRRAPLVPILRQADLEVAGCELDLPDHACGRACRGRRTGWPLRRSLRRFAGRNQIAPVSDEMRALLGALAADDFAAIRSNPPLLYHNDPTAWSGGSTGRRISATRSGCGCSSRTTAGFRLGHERATHVIWAVRINSPRTA